MANIRKKRKRRLLKKLAIGFAAFVLILGITGWFARTDLVHDSATFVVGRASRAAIDDVSAGIESRQVDPRCDVARLEVETHSKGTERAPADAVAKRIITEQR